MIEARRVVTEAWRVVIEAPGHDGDQKLPFTSRRGSMSCLRGTIAGEKASFAGQVFFASPPTFLAGFDFKEALTNVRIDLTHAHFWDLTAVGALDKVVLRFRREGAEVELIGLNEASATIVDRLAIHDKSDALERMLEH